jgi:hypothetical protein
MASGDIVDWSFDLASNSSGEIRPPLGTYYLIKHICFDSDGQILIRPSTVQDGNAGSYIIGLWDGPIELYNINLPISYDRYLFVKNTSDTQSQINVEGVTIPGPIIEWSGALTALNDTITYNPATNVTITAIGWAGSIITKKVRSNITTNLRNAGCKNANGSSYDFTYGLNIPLDSDSSLLFTALVGASTVHVFGYID